MKRSTSVGIGQVLGIGLLVLAALGPPVQADRIRLKGGGEMRGRVLVDPAAPDRIRIETGTLARPIEIDRAQVVEIVPERDVHDDYDARRAQTPMTAQALFDLGTWCERNQLPKRAEEHFTKAVEIDPDFAPAHKKLGHVLQDGVWITFDQRRSAQGLVKYRGRWIAPQERDRLLSQSVRAAETESWTRQIQVLRQNLAASTSEQQSDAERQLLDIRDASAIPALVRVFSGESESLRALLVAILDGIPGVESRDALLERLMMDDDPGVRQAIVAALGRRGDPDIPAVFQKRLHSADPTQVGRAARALADLHVTAAVPELLKRLVRVETQMVLVPTAPQTPITFTNGRGYGEFAGGVVAPGAGA